MCYYFDLITIEFIHHDLQLYCTQISEAQLNRSSVNLSYISFQLI